MILFAVETVQEYALNWHTILFMLFALISIVFGAGVLFSNNIVRMAFYLVLCLGSTAGLFFLAGAEFVGSMQLMIYVGGTLVLLIFGVMLTAQESFVSMRTNSAEWVLAIVVGSALLLLLLRSTQFVEAWSTPAPQGHMESVALSEVKVATQIGAGLSGVRVDSLEQEDAVLRGGMSGYLLPFIIVSVHLLVVLIGAAYLARAKHRSEPASG